MSRAALPAAIPMLREVRAYVLRLTDGLGADRLTATPPGWNNHALWHLGHLAVTQQLLHYGRAGLPLGVPDAAVARFRKGTSPRAWEGTQDVDADVAEVRRWLSALPERLAGDYAAGRFAGYQPYETSTGIVLRDIDDALAFNNVHEGMHVGQVLALLRLTA